MKIAERDIFHLFSEFYVTASSVFCEYECVILIIFSFYVSFEAISPL